MRVHANNRLGLFVVSMTLYGNALPLSSADVGVALFRA